MLQFLGQLSVTAWRLATTALTLPLTFFFSLIEYFGSGVLTLFSSLLWACFFSLGLVFLFRVALKPFLPVRTFFARLTSKTKFALFGILVGISYLVSVGYFVLAMNPDTSYYENFVPGAVWFVILLLNFAGVASVFWYLFQGAAWLGRRWTKTSPLLRRSITALGVVLFCYPFFIVAIFVIWLLWDPLSGIATAEHHTLHAAIKNTCLLDSEKVNCPQRLEDIRIIEPEVYDSVSQHSQLKYEYNPENNTYIFVVRYSPIQAAMFSNHFEQETDWQADYKELEVEIWGKDRIKDSLLPGDWTFPEWKYRYTPPDAFWYD